MQNARNSNACSRSCAAWRGESLSPTGRVADLRFGCFWSYFHVADRLTYYAFCVNIYAECVTHPYWMRCSRSSARRSWRRRCSLPGNPGFCPNWQSTLRLHRPVFSANSKALPKAASCNTRRMADAPITKPRPPPLCMRSFAPCFPKRRVSFHFSNPNWPALAPRLRGRLSMGRSRAARNRGKAMLICSSLVPLDCRNCFRPCAESNSNLAGK